MFLQSTEEVTRVVKGTVATGQYHPLCPGRAVSLDRGTPTNRTSRGVSNRTADTMVEAPHGNSRATKVTRVWIATPRDKEVVVEATEEVVAATEEEDEEEVAMAAVVEAIR